MKSSICAFALGLVLLGASSCKVFAQDDASGPKDPVSKLIWEMGQMHQGKTICFVGSTSIPEIREKVLSYLKLGVGDSINSQKVAMAMWTLFPCPFSPARTELRPALLKDVEGVWLYPPSSQKLRYGPRSTQQPPTGTVPTKCEAIGYFPGGELRNAVLGGNAQCPFEKATDLDQARKNPRVSSWELINEGRVAVTRTDVVNHIEEWDTYVVQSAFTMYAVQFSVGDVVTYLRKEKGNEVGAATQFRHLQRLP